MKTRELMAKYKVLFCTIPIILLTIILLLVTTFSKPSQLIKLLDISGNEYSKDLTTEFDEGKDITQFKNTYKILEYTKEISGDFYIWLESNYYNFKSSYSPDNFIDVPIKLKNDEYPRLNMSKARFVESDAVQGVKVEFYISSNIPNNKFFNKLFNINHIYQTWSLNKEIAKVEDGNGNFYTKNEKINRDALLIYTLNEDLPSIWCDGLAYDRTEIDKIVYSYIVVITHNPNVNAMPINAQDKN